MCSTSIFSCITIMISNFIIFFCLSNNYCQTFLYKYNRVLHFHMVSAALLLIILFLSLPLYTSCLFSIPLNEDIDFEKSDRISFAFLQMKFQDYFYIQQSCLLYIQDLHKSQMMLYKIFDIDILNPNILVSS